MLTVIAIGGNALSGQSGSLEAENLATNCRQAANLITHIVQESQVLLVHGNGPQIGLLALQTQAYKSVKPYPFDILNAESQGMVGYLLQQAISHQRVPVVTVLTQAIVATDDPAFTHFTKPIGPKYTQSQAAAIQKAYSWCLKKQGNYYRRVVPSPKPIAIQELAIIKQLVHQGIWVIAGGGGGIPCIKDSQGGLVGIEAVIDKDLTASVLAVALAARRLIILTDIDAVYSDWNTPNQSPVNQTTPHKLRDLSFAAGSMQPKVEAVCHFVEQTGCPAAIGHLEDLADILTQTRGTWVFPD